MSKMLPVVLGRGPIASKCCALGSRFYGVGLPLISSGVCSLLIWSELLEFMVGCDHSPTHSTSEHMHGSVCKETKKILSNGKKYLKSNLFFSSNKLDSAKSRTKCC